MKWVIFTKSVQNNNLWWQKMSQNKCLVIAWSKLGSENKFGSLNHSLVSWFSYSSIVAHSMVVSFTLSKSCICQAPSYRAGGAGDTLHAGWLKSDGVSGCFASQFAAKQMIWAKTTLILFQELLSWKAEPYHEWQCWEHKAKAHTGFGNSKSTLDLKLSQCVI